MENSPLGRLPPELRKGIYTYLLHEPDSIRLFVAKDQMTVTTLAKEIRSDPYLESSLGGNWRNRSKTREIVQLFTVCRKIRAETLLYYFAINHLRFYTGAWSSSTSAAIATWLQPLLFCHPAVNTSMGLKCLTVTFELGSIYGRGDVVWARDVPRTAVESTSQFFYPGTPMVTLLMCYGHSCGVRKSSYYGGSASYECRRTGAIERTEYDQTLQLQRTPLLGLRDNRVSLEREVVLVNVFNDWR